MKNLLGLLYLFVFSNFTFSQNVPLRAVAKVQSSTFSLNGDKFSGTCFMVVKNDKQYFVTAAHLFDPSHKSGDLVPIQMLIQNKLQSFTAKVYFHENRKVDIAIIRLSENISQRIQLPDQFLKYKDTLQRLFEGNGVSMDSIRVNVATEVLFFGFPLGNLGTDAFGIKFPLVKRAMTSGLVQYNSVELILLDGHNNLGFSGGPAVAYDTSSKKLCLLGVISGYIPETVDVQHKKDTFSVNENSGIIVCYGRNYLEDIFTKNEKDLH